MWFASTYFIGRTDWLTRTHISELPNRLADSQAHIWLAEPIGWLARTYLTGRYAVGLCRTKERSTRGAILEKKTHRILRFRTDLWLDLTCQHAFLTSRPTYASQKLRLGYTWFFYSIFQWSATIFFAGSLRKMKIQKCPYTTLPTVTRPPPPPIEKKMTVILIQKKNEFSTTKNTLHLSHPTQ